MNQVAAAGCQKNGVVMTCSNCQEPRHNSRSCKNPHKPKPIVHRTRGRGRPPTRSLEENKVQEAQPEVHTVDQYDALGIGRSSEPKILYTHLSQGLSTLHQLIR